MTLKKKKIYITKIQQSNPILRGCGLCACDASKRGGCGLKTESHDVTLNQLIIFYKSAPAFFIYLSIDLLLSVALITHRDGRIILAAAS